VVNTYYPKTQGAETEEAQDPVSQKKEKEV
jgi:hypothetical protein